MNLDKRWINQGTGEIIDNVESIRTKEQVENQRKGLQYATKEIIPLPFFLQEQFGNFIHSRYNALLEKTNYDTATIFRFIYLCTYMEYDTGYIIWNGQRVNQHSLGNILNVQKNTITTIKKKLFECELVFEDADNNIYVNLDYCYRGDISNNKQYRRQCTRIFNDGIRELYSKTIDPREHKVLGKLILLLPYVNVYHNVICMNIKEKDMDKVILPNSKDMDEILHSTIRNSDRQMKQLLSITVGGEPALLVIKHKNVHMYAVNPRIYYGGTKLSNVETLNGYFKAKGGLD